jgi:hypothetical protein
MGCSMVGGVGEAGFSAWLRNDRGVWVRLGKDNRKGNGEVRGLILRFAKGQNDGFGAVMLASRAVIRLRLSGFQAEGVFLDDGVDEDFAGDAVDFGFGGGGVG